MSDIVKKLRAYPGDPAAVMTRAMLNEAIDEIVRLRAEFAASQKDRDWMAKLHDQRQEERNIALAKVAKLREALEPFASRCISDKAPNSDTVPVTVGDLRRARAVLKETGGGNE